jgi:hypothetical protein
VHRIEQQEDTQRKKEEEKKETRTAKKLSGKAHIQEHNDEKMTRKA